MPVNRYIQAPNHQKFKLGDTYFKGFRSRPHSSSLPDGVARYAGNVRFERNAGVVRAGTKARSTDVALTDPPLILPFTLASDVAVTSITRSGATATVTTTSAHGYSTGNRVNIRGAVETDYNGDFQITVTGTNTFTYTVGGTPTTPATGTIVANKGPRIFDVYGERVRGSCVYSDDDNQEGIVIASSNTAYVYRDGQAAAEIAYPSGEVVAATDTCDLVQFLDRVYMFRGRRVADPVAVTSITRFSTTATVTTSANHGLTTNDYVDIRGAAPDGYNGIVQVTVTGLTTFTYTVSGALSTPATGTITIMQVKPVLSWDRNVANDFVVVTGGPNVAGGTLRNMPAADWGDHFMQRMVLPYDRDELILSDALDAGTYDTAYSQLRIDPGTKDWLVGVHPFQEFQLLVFYRKSIHMLLLNAGLSLARVSTITRDIGCVSRRSIVTCGNRILWLSDQGVHSMTIGDTISLRNDSLPLSDPIQDQINNINFARADDAVGVYFNNRYYLAVPVGSATSNNRVLVYNFINQEWESVDSYPGDFDVQDWHVLDYNSEKRLHACTTFGFVFLMEENDVDEFGSTSQVSNHVITGTLYTRDYGIGLDRARYNRVQLTGDADTGDALGVSFRTKDPDILSTNVLQYTSASDTDFSIRGTLRGRGQSGSVEVTTTAGRPEIRSVMVEGVNSDRQTVNTT